MCAHSKYLRETEEEGPFSSFRSLIFILYKTFIKNFKRILGFFIFYLKIRKVGLFQLEHLGYKNNMTCEVRWVTSFRTCHLGIGLSKISQSSFWPHSWLVTWLCNGGGVMIGHYQEQRTHIPFSVRLNTYSNETLDLSKEAEVGEKKCCQQTPENSRRSDSCVEQGSPSARWMEIWKGQKLGLYKWTIICEGDGWGLRDGRTDSSWERRCISVTVVLCVWLMIRHNHLDV